MIYINAELSAYNEFRKENPEFFVNRPGTAFEFVFEPDQQCSVGAGINDGHQKPNRLGVAGKGLRPQPLEAT